MIPKAIRHRKKVRENENIIPNQENQELEMRVIEVSSKERENKKTLDYKATFLAVPKLVDRKPVFVSKEVRDQLDQIARRLGNRGTSVSGFIENMAKHHLEEYREEVERLYKE
jgi:hypothetical protein